MTSERKLMKYLLVLILTIFTISCGDGDNNSNNNNPDNNNINDEENSENTENTISDSNTVNVSGVYDCVAGCDGPICNYDDTITVVQEGLDLTVIGNLDPDTPLTGTIDENGNFSVSTPDQFRECSGTYNNGVATTKCSENNQDCQAVIYEKQ